MKVTGYGTIRPTTTTRKPGQTSSTTSFSDYLSAAETAEATSAGTVSDVSATNSLSGLLALQEITEEERRKQRLVKRGSGMLDSLENLRQQLLIGAIPADMLSELAAQLEQEKQQVDDPNLIMLLEDIELRVAVELAKLEVAFAARSEF
jgi:hypothetical protein